MVESVIATTARDFAYNLAVLRPTAVYGPGQDLHKGLGVVTVFVRNMLLDEPLRLFGSTENGRDFLHVSDLADCVVAAVELRLGGTYELGGPEVVRLRELIGLLEGLIGRTATVQREPDSPVDPLLVALDNGPFTAATGWAPRRHLAESLPEVIADVAARLGLGGVSVRHSADDGS